MNIKDERPRLMLAVLGRSLSARLAESLGADGRYSVSNGCSGAAEIVRRAEQVSPRLLLMDIQYLQQDGLDLLGRLHYAVSGMHVLLVGQFADAREAAHFVRHGVDGIVGRTAATDAFIKAIDHVLDGEIWLPRRLVTEILRLDVIDPDSSSSRIARWRQELSEREVIVAEAVSRGLSNRQIATDLEISENTVRAHISNIFRKLQLKRRIDLIIS